MHRTLEIISTVFTPAQLEHYPEPQIALAGRSNVGKSSLINCLAGRKSLAKISSTPGKTRSLNFYQVRPDGFFLVDFPGYGYARTSKVERSKWGTLIDHYLRQTKELKAVGVLLDSRLEPQKLDLELVGYLQAMSIPIIAVLTKADKCKQRDLAARQNEWQDILKGTRPLLFSSKTGKGSEKLWQIIADFAGTLPAPPTP
ncbi:MAG: ribosome biogenesis GTP-binding protein YihA/YsxC [Proteobacteria bacterium]|nr:ribosome biogenesis GTP-binding protein YihA/YsxC [Pseudomonadota bacterium]MBU1612485.1 ribosome biogenesis GTP-binding protein YihA/YsxC [Pseudomonadota bacterium]